MTPRRPAFHVQPRYLDPCVLRNHLRERPEFNVPLARPLDPARRLAAEKVIEHSFLAVAHHLSTPPEAWQDDGRRSVRLWDLLEFSVAQDGGDLRLEFLSRDPDMSGCLAHADLSQPIGGFAFPAALDPLLVSGCRAVGLSPRCLPGPTGDFMRRVLGRTFRPYVQWNRLRRSVLQALAPDPLLVSLTRRAFEGGRASLHSFNWVARHVRELSLLAVERPRLLPFLQLVEHAEGSPLANLDSALSASGMTASARRKLERWGFQPFSQATDFGTLEDRDTVIARYANLLDRLQVAREPTTMFTQLAMKGVRPDAPDWYLRALWDEVESLGDDIDEENYPVDFEVTATWLAASPPEPDENQKQAGWPWIVERAWEHHLRTDSACAQPWAVPCDDLAIGRYVVKPLRDLASLREEALTMRNCLETLEAGCRAGKLAAFSVREGGRRVACLSIARITEPTPSWAVHQVAGKANAPAAKDIADVAMQVARRLNAVR